MQGRVIISLPIDAVDPADAIDTVLDWLSRAIGRGATRQEARAWLREQAEVRFEPDPPAAPESDHA